MLPVVGGDPFNYLSYFKRATVYLAIGRAKSALPDLDKVIELKPDFRQVRKLFNKTCAILYSVAGQNGAGKYFVKAG